MTAVAQIVQFTVEEHMSMLREAAAEGARIALQEQGLSAESDDPIPTKEAMKLAGYSSYEYWRKFCKENGIKPVGRRERKLQWRPSHIRSALFPKNSRKK